MSAQHSESITVNTMRQDLIQAAVDAASVGYDAEQGHRTRASLTPQLAAEHLAKAAVSNGERACVIYHGPGVVLAVRFRDDARTTEPWEACSIAGYPTDDHYREAYRQLFEDEERQELERTLPTANQPLPTPRDPRPTPDGWAISRWITDRKTGFDNAKRVVVPAYEDYLKTTPPGAAGGAKIIRDAEPWE